MHARVHVAYASTRGSGCATEAATASATPAATHRRQGLKRHDAVRATKGPPLTSSAPLSLFSPLSPARDTSEWREHARIARRSWRRWCCNCAHDAGWDLFFELGCEVCVCEGCVCAGEGEREREICRLYALAAAPSITQRPRRFDGSVGIATPRNKHHEPLHGCTHTCILTQTDLQTPSRKPARCKGARPGVSVSTHEAKDCSIKNIDFRAGPLIHCTGALYYGHECDHGV